jgi:hypothetical protein
MCLGVLDSPDRRCALVHRLGPLLQKWIGPRKRAIGQNSPHSYAQPRANYLDTEEWITPGGAPCNRTIFS